MLQRNPTRLPLKMEDAAEYDAVVKQRSADQQKAAGDSSSSNGATDTKAATVAAATAVASTTSLNNAPSIIGAQGDARTAAERIGLGN
jgi:hypothetical protein